MRIRGTTIRTLVELTLSSGPFHSRLCHHDVFLVGRYSLVGWTSWSRVVIPVDCLAAFARSSLPVVRWIFLRASFPFHSRDTMSKLSHRPREFSQGVFPQSLYSP